MTFLLLVTLCIRKATHLRSGRTRAATILLVSNPELALVVHYKTSQSLIDIFKVYSTSVAKSQFIFFTLTFDYAFSLNIS